MKLLGALSACVGATLAFSNTAPVFASWQLPQQKPIVKASEVAEFFSKVSAEWCSEKNTDPTVIIRVKNLSKASSELKKFTVKYDLANDLDLLTGSPCEIEYSTEYPKSMDASKLYVVDLDEDTEYFVQDLLSKFPKVIVQGKPLTVETRKHSSEQGWKRRHANEAMRAAEETDNDDVKLAQEAEDGFRAAELMLAASGEDSVVTAVADSNNNNNSTKPAKGASVFTNYQFFTPGIWLCIIVTFFLVYVTLTAIHWISSIELTYKSFEKQVDFQKKTE